MTYQILAFKSSPLFDNDPHSFFYVVITTILDFIQNNVSITIPLIIAAIILAIVYFLLPVILDASMIQVMARKRNGQEISLLNGLKYGVLRFLPYFEFTLLIKTISLFSIITEAAFILRNLGPGVFQSFIPVFIIFLIVTLILHILFTFAEYFIIIDEEKVMSGIVKSCTLVILNLQKTFILVILMLIIAIRIIVQVILVIVIPAIVISGLAYFTSLSLPQYGLITLVALSGVFLMFASYLAAVVHVFSVAVWTFTFIDFTAEQHLTARGKAAFENE